MHKHTGSNIVCLVGAPRSGTTWLQYLLAAHPDIKSGRESYVFMKLCELKEDWLALKKNGIGMACYQTDAEFFEILDDFKNRQLDALTKGVGTGQIFLEKTPSHALAIPQIAALLPEARFIHILRDGRDVVASMLAAKKGWGEEWAPKNARRAAKIWERHIHAVESAKSGLKPGQFYELRYEALLEDTAAELRKCIDFLGMQWSEEALRKAVEANTSDKMRKTTQLAVSGEVAKTDAANAAMPDGFVRKAKAGSWRQDLSMSQRFQIWRVARKTLGDCGYAWPYFFL